MCSAQRRVATLGRAEQVVMDYLWTEGPSSAEQIRTGIRREWPMKDSTVRTVLARLERKGYVVHDVDGRAFVYRAVNPPASVAARAVKQIIERFCNGSAEQLMLGLVDEKVVSPAQLKRMLAKIEAAEQKK